MKVGDSAKEKITKQVVFFSPDPELEIKNFSSNIRDFSASKELADRDVGKCLKEPGFSK